VLSTRDTYPDVERWFTERSGAPREVQLRDLSAQSAREIADELARRAPELRVRVSPGAVAIECEPSAPWTADRITGFLGLLADMTTLAGGRITLVFVHEHTERALRVGA
jgi:hypothetical protein